MTIQYEVVTTPLGATVINATFTNSDRMLSIPADPANSDYQAYLAYVANGNKVPDSTLAANSATPQA
jgi:hypothetical protein